MTVSRPPLMRSMTAMSSATLIGSCKGSSSADIDADKVVVRARTVPAFINGVGLQALSAPWCSSNVAMKNPFWSANSAISSMALYLSESD